MYIGLGSAHIKGMRRNEYIIAMRAPWKSCYVLEGQYFMFSRSEHHASILTP